MLTAVATVNAKLATAWAIVLGETFGRNVLFLLTPEEWEPIPVSWEPERAIILASHCEMMLEQMEFS